MTAIQSFWRGMFAWLLVLVPVPGMVLADQSAEGPPPDYLASMSVEERQRTGVDKLDERQRAALNAWLARQLSGLRPAAVSQSREASLPAEKIVEAEVEKRVQARLQEEKVRHMGRADAFPREIVSARIDGAFRGWRGATEFRLDNGQVWQQTDGETYYVRTLHNPEVELVPMALGSWGLRLKSTGRTVKVRRVR